MSSIRACKKKNAKSNMENYMCNALLVNGSIKLVKFGQFILKKETKQYKNYNSKIKEGYICNQLTGKSIKIEGHTHNKLYKINAVSKYIKFKIGDVVLYETKGEYDKVIFEGETTRYKIYQLEKGK
jgi:nucleoid DNA-binding protein